MKRALVLWALLSLALIGCAQSEELTIGYIGPLSGGAADIGTTTLQSAKLAVADIPTEQVELIAADGKCNGDDAVTAARKLITVDDVDFILFGGCSGEVLSAAPVLEEHGVFGLATIAGSPDVSGLDDHLFRLSLSDATQARYVAKHMREHNRTRAAVLYENVAYAKSIKEAFVHAARKHNITITAELTYKSDTKDVRTQLTKIGESSPDAVFIIPGGATKTAGLVTKQLNASGIRTKLYGTDQFTFDDVQAYQAYYEGMTVAQAEFNTSRPEAKRVLQAYRERYGKNCSLGLFCATSYDGVMLLHQAYKRCGNELGCVSNFFSNVDQHMSSGRVRFDGDQDAVFSYDYKEI